MLRLILRLILQCRRVGLRVPFQMWAMVSLAATIGLCYANIAPITLLFVLAYLGMAYILFARTMPPHPHAHGARKPGNTEPSPLWHACTYYYYYILPRVECMHLTPYGACMHIGCVCYR